jgi:hypothetical protein
MRARVIAGVLVVACCLGCRPTPAARPWADVIVPRDARFEVTLTADARGRAPDDVPVRATFTHDGHSIDVGGFARGGRFVVRFAPRALGRWDWTARVDEREVDRGSFVAVDRPGERGFVGIDPRDPHRLALEDGAPFWILGENRINVYDPTWNFEGLTIEAYVARMAKFGMTTLRVFVFNDCHSETSPDGHQLGCLEPSVGRFDEREAQSFDRIFEAAERSGVYVVLVPFAVGFTPRPDTWKSWDDNPYSKLVKTPIEMFTSDVTRAAAERRLRYVVDRWGYSKALLAIDLLNEPEWDGEIPERVWIPWAEAMARAVRRVDPYGHLITTGSVGLSTNYGGDERPWWSSPEDSLVQWHLYGKEFYEPHALAAEMTRRIDETWGFGKPVFCGEFAYGGEDKATYDHTHDGIWSALMSGGGALAHSAPPFEIDSDEPMTDARASHFRVLASFLHEMDGWGDVEPRKDVAPSVVGMNAWSLRSADGARRAIWVLAPREVDVVANATVSVPDLPNGDYRVAWRDDVTGAALDVRTVRARVSEPTTLAVPTFSRHAAALVTRLP